jgi:hypothetical protein
MTRDASSVPHLYVCLPILLRFPASTLFSFDDERISVRERCAWNLGRMNCHAQRIPRGVVNSEYADWLKGGSSVVVQASCRTAENESQPAVLGSETDIGRQTEGGVLVLFCTANECILGCELKVVPDQQCIHPAVNTSTLCLGSHDVDWSACNPCN